MSATNEAARVGSSSSDGAVSVFDTRSAAGGQALIATLLSLDHLVRTGRVPGIAGWAGKRLGMTALHAMSRPTATELLERVVDEFDPEVSFVGEFGPVMVVHTGPGLSGLAWWWDDPEPTATSGVIAS